MPAVKGARKLMLQHLEEAEAAVERLPRPDDPEALHDLRVALRHLRTYLAAYRKLFADTVSDKSLETLRELTQLTGPARDAEVQAQWLAEHSRSRRATTSPATHLRTRLTQHHEELLLDIRERFARDFPRLAARLRRQLKRAKASGRRTFGKDTAKRVVRQGHRLRERLDRIEGMADVEGAHASRITAKRVRYLLEPFGKLDGVHDTIQRLKELQDAFGELHDLHVMLETMSDVPESAHASRKRRAGSELAALASTARRRMTRLYAQSEQRWRGAEGAELDEALAQAASTLRKAGR